MFTSKMAEKNHQDINSRANHFNDLKEEIKQFGEVDIPQKFLDLLARSKKNTGKSDAQKRFKVYSAMYHMIHKKTGQGRTIAWPMCVLKAVHGELGGTVKQPPQYAINIDLNTWLKGMK